MDGYDWKENLLMVGALTKACKLVNDTVKTRLPIHYSFLEMMLNELVRYYDGQQLYLQAMFKAMFALGYYGLLRVGQLMASQHVVKACNVHLVSNKDKLLIILYSSKMHDCSTQPQKIKIVSNRNNLDFTKKVKLAHRNFCPFKLIHRYIQNKKQIRKVITSDEQFFIYKDGMPVLADQVQKILRNLINRLTLNGALYDVHSLRIGRSSDMAKFGYTIEEIKRIGRWKLNAVFKYIRD